MHVVLRSLEKFYKSFLGKLSISEAISLEKNFLIVEAFHLNS